MGSEADCTLRYDGCAVRGKALLETKEIIFRGDVRLKIAFSEIDSLEADQGELRIGTQQGVAVFELGRDAARWADKIRNPRGLMQKLGVKPGVSVSVLGVDDEDFLAQLRSLSDKVSEGSLQSPADIVFYEADEPDDLVRLAELERSIKRDGAVWVVSPKGKGARVRDAQVMAAAREAGLVDNKVVSFSDTHTALKLVVPRALR